MDGSSIWVLESPVVMVEGEAIAWSVEFLGATEVSEPASTVYKNGADVTDEVCISEDEDSVSGATVTLKTITAKSGDGGHSYIVVVQALVDGNLEMRKLEIGLVRPGDEP